MATAATIKKNIAKLEAALKSKATPKSLKSKLETQLVKSKAELSGLNKGSKPKASSTKSTQTALQKLKEMVNKNKKLKTYKKSGVDLERDADRPALPIGRRTAKASGKTYYEYRANRIDVKQPPKRYPKLEKGGYMAKGGEVKVGDKYTDKNNWIYDVLSVTNDRVELLNQNEYYKPIEQTYYLDDIKRFIKKGQFKKLEKGGYMADGGEMYKNVFKGITFETIDEAKEFIKLGKPFIRKQLRDGNYVLVNNGQEFFIAEVKDKMAKDAYMAKGGKLAEFLVILTDEDGYEDDVIVMAKDEDDAVYKAEQLRGYESSQNGVVMLTDYDGNKIEYAKGGSIPNNYEGKTEKEVWDNWNYDQKFHFLSDHYDDKSNPFGIKFKDLSDIADKSSYDELPNKIKRALSYHIAEGQYAKGGVAKKAYTYVPNKDVKELMVVLNNQLKKINGTDILDGVYLKNKAAGSSKSSSQSSSKLTADSAYDKIMAKAKEEGADKEDLENLKKEDVQKLIDAGYNMEDLYIIYIGVKSEINFECDNEVSTINGILSIGKDYVERQVNLTVDAAKGKKYELGLKYPLFNWKSIIKKYNVKNNPIIIESKREWGADEYKIETFEIFVGDKVVFGHQTNYATYKKGKLDYETKEGNEVKDYTKVNAYQKERDSQAGFNTGYWGIVSSEKSVLYDITKMLVSQKDGYVKDLDFFVNRLGGIGAEELDKNDIKYEKGGYMADGGMSQKYYITYATQNFDGKNYKNGFDLYSTNGDANEEIFIGNYPKLEQANKVAENKGLERLPMYMRMAKGGKLSGLEKSIEKTEKAIEYFEKEKENGNEYADYALKSLNSYLAELKEEQGGSKMAKGGYYAKGGAMEHGLKRGDTIIDDMSWDNSVKVLNNKTGYAVVHLETGERKEMKAMGGEMHRTQE